MNLKLTSIQNTVFVVLSIGSPYPSAKYYLGMYIYRKWIDKSSHPPRQLSAIHPTLGAGGGIQ